MQRPLDESEHLFIAVCAICTSKMAFFCMLQRRSPLSGRGPPVSPVVEPDIGAAPVCCKCRIYVLDKDYIALHLDRCAL